MEGKEVREAGWPGKEGKPQIPPERKANFPWPGSLSTAFQGSKDQFCQELKASPLS